MRRGTEAHAAARARIRLTLGDAGAPRVRGRRARPLPGLREVSLDALLPAADAALLAGILDTAAAIAHGHEIAAVIDARGRQTLTGALGETTRRTAIAHRRMAFPVPDGGDGGAIALLERIAASRARARALWSWGVPASIAARVPAVAARVEDPERMSACLGLATRLAMEGATHG